MLRYAAISTLAIVLSAMSSCRSLDSRDILMESVANASHTRRATVIVRQFVIDGRVDDNPPVTYVLLGDDQGEPHFPAGEDFPADQVVTKPTHCGRLSLEWNGDDNLQVVCERCGLSISALGQHADQVGLTKIEYVGFPDSSSWETAPPAVSGWVR
jgi:hypothetical protein